MYGCSLSEWFDRLPNLSQEDYDTEWKQIEHKYPSLKEANTGDLRQRLAAMKAFKRSQAWALNYILEQTSDNDIPDDLSENLRKRLKDW